MGSDNQCSWEIGEPNGGRGYNNIHKEKGYVGNPDPDIDHTSDNLINFVAGQGLSSDSKKEGVSGHYNNSNEWIQSPAINCAGYYNIELSYWRWANFEEGYDFAFLEISTDGNNWDIIYSPESLQDIGWVQHILDISKYADGQATIYLRWRSESDESIFYAGWNIDDIVITGEINTNDADSRIDAGSITAPATISSLTDSYNERVTFGEIIITDAGSGDNLPTIIDKLIIIQGANNTVLDWKKAINKVYLYNAATDSEISDSINNDTITFSNTDFLTIPDGGSKKFEISFYLEAILTEASDNERFEFVLDYGDVIVDPAGSFLGYGSLSTGASNLRLDIHATQMEFVVEPEQLISVDRNILPVVEIAAQDANGNIDIDYSGTITLDNDGGLTMVNNTKSTIGGVAYFNNAQFTQTGGPVVLFTTHTGGIQIADANSQVSVTVEDNLDNVIFFDNFDNSGVTGWASGATYGSNSWEYGVPNGGMGYSNLKESKGYIGNPDPTTDHTSGNTVNNVYGQGLANSSKTEGVSSYFSSSEEWLMSPAIDLTNYYNTQFTFWRWANFEPYYDTAYVEISVDGTTWLDLEQPYFPTDIAWTKVTIDISSIADRQKTVYLRWRMVSDKSIHYSGWNIDDIEVSGIFSEVIEWTGTTSNVWNNPANWNTNKVPSKLLSVIINSNTPYRPIVTSTEECKDLTIRKNSVLEIDNSGSITVFGDVLIYSDIENYGAIIDRGSLVVRSINTITYFTPLFPLCFVKIINRS